MKQRRLGFIIIAIFICILVAGGIFGATYLINKKVNDATLRASQQVELQACHRLNISRAESNRNQLANYDFDQLFIDLIIGSERHQTASVKRNRHQRHVTRRFIRGLRAQSNAQEWIPLTNCPRAVYHGVTSPLPIRFGHMLPSQGALQLSQDN